MNYDLKNRTYQPNQSTISVDVNSQNQSLLKHLVKGNITDKHNKIKESNLLKHL